MSDQQGVVFRCVLDIKDASGIFPPSVAGLSFWLQKNGFTFSEPADIGTPFVINIDLSKDLK